MDVGKSRTPAPELCFTKQVSQLTDGSSWHFLPKSSDIAAVKNKFVMLVGHITKAQGQANWSHYRSLLKLKLKLTELKLKLTEVGSRPISRSMASTKGAVVANFQSVTLNAI